MRVLAELGEHAAREDLEARVAGGVAERVVDVLEAVDVEIEHRDVLLAAARARDRLLQQMLKLHAVGDLRQRVGAREVANALLDALALVDVVRGVDLALHRVAVAHVGDRVRDADGRAVGPQHGAFARARGHAFGTPPVVRQDQVVGELADQRRFVLLEELDGGGIGSFDLAVGVGDQQRLAHARQQAIEIVARDRARAQVGAHRVDGGRELAQLRRIAEAGRVELAVRAALQRSRDGAQRRGEAIDERAYRATARRRVPAARQASASQANAGNGQRSRREQVGQSSQRRRDGSRKQQDRSHETALERRVQKRREHTGGLDSFYYLVILIGRGPNGPLCAERPSSPGQSSTRTRLPHAVDCIRPAAEACGTSTSSRLLAGWPWRQRWLRRRSARLVGRVARRDRRLRRRRALARAFQRATRRAEGSRDSAAWLGGQRRGELRRIRRRPALRRRLRGVPAQLPRSRRHVRA